MVGLDGKRLETESNVLLASIENMQYAVTLDVLHMVLRIMTGHIFLIINKQYSLLDNIILFIYFLTFLTGFLCFWTCPKNCNVRQEWWFAGSDSISRLIL